MVTVPEQLPNVLDRAHPDRRGRAAPTAVIIPSDVQELEYSAPTHAFKMVPSSLGVAVAARSVPDDAAVRRAADLLNAGRKVAMLVGPGRARRPRGARAGGRPARRRGGEGAAGQGRPVRRAALGHRLDRAARHPARATR